MSFEGRCGSCKKFRNTDDYYDNAPYYEYYQSYHPEEVNDTNRGKGYCKRNNWWYYPTDSCYYYDKRSGYYITTMVCERLGMGYDCETMNAIRFLRDEVLQKDEKNKGILDAYDIVGPKIAEKLADEDIEVIKNLFDSRLKSIVGLIKLHQYDNATDRYVNMTKCLMKTYGVTYDGVVEENDDHTKVGHSMVYVKQ